MPRKITEKSIKRYELERLAGIQLEWLIEKGREVDRCKAEWLRRNGLPYPYRRNISGIVKYNRSDDVSAEELAELKERGYDR